MQYTHEKIVVGLDIGTTKVCAVVGKHNGERIEVIGIGQCPSQGLRKGFVIDIESTAASIRKAVEEAERMAGYSINSVVVGIADRFMRGQNSRGMVTLKGREVVEQDVQRAIVASEALPLLDDRKTLHIFPQEFIVDAHTGIVQPLGISGERLEARVHIVTAAAASIENIVKACGQAGLGVTDVVLQPIASAKAVLMSDERELGVVLIDIGGGTTDIAIFKGGRLWHTAVIPVAGSHLTGDLAIGLRVAMSEAERIKCLYGCCQHGRPDQHGPVEILTINDTPARVANRHEISLILQARVSELFTMIAKELRRSGSRGDLLAGAVITGGSSLLTGLEQLAGQALGMPVRLGQPFDIQGVGDCACRPQFSTGVGLVLNGYKPDPQQEMQPPSLLDAVKQRINRLLEQAWAASGHR